MKRLLNPTYDREAGHVHALRWAVFAVLFSSVILFSVRTIHWPIIGDASLIHYAVFPMDHGSVPYRDIAEMNLPGSYIAEWMVIHSIGGSDLAWRFFDLFLGFAGIAAMMVMAAPVDWLAGFWAGTLLLLIHGRDGIIEVGQRDFILAVCLLAGYAFLFSASRKNRPWMAFPFGLLTAFAAAIKPTLLPLLFISLFLLFLECRAKERRAASFLGYGAGGALLLWASVTAYLLRAHAMRAFLGRTASMVRYHASLAHRPAGYLLLHSISPLLPLLVIWLLLLLLRRKRPGWEQIHLWIGAAFGLFSYLAQAKGYSYQRYPLIGFLLLLLISLELVSALRGRRMEIVLAVAAIAFGGFFLAPASAWSASRYDWRELGNIAMLQQDLTELGGSNLSGHIQCVDSIHGCTNTLYRMKLVEVSSVFYDEFLFGPASVKAVAFNREKFWTEIQANPPQVIVVTDKLFPSGPDHYEKLARWPEFDAYLSQNYKLYLDRVPVRPVRWWSRPEIPAGYRIYLRK